jgi:hypothetical protein
MRKYLLIFLIVTAVGLAGCFPQVQASPTASSNSLPAPTVDLSLPPEADVPNDSGCTVKTLRPTPGPTAESIYPPASETDWVKGPADAKVTIIEYGDFQ